RSSPGFGAPLAPSPDERHLRRASPWRSTMSTATPQPQPQPPQAQPLQPTPHQEAVHYAEENVPELRIYSHSNLLYWWPVWAVGYLMGFLTWFDGQTVAFRDGHTELFADNRWMGVVFTIVLFLVILMSNVMLRGVSSIVLVLGILFLALL